MRDGWRKTTLADVATVNPRVVGVTSESPFITMSDVEEWGRWAKSTSSRGERGGVRARGGDTLVARITPCLENGKIAQVPIDWPEVGGSTEFIVVRAGDQLLPEYVYLWAQSHDTHQRAISKMIGSTGRQRVSAQDFAALPILVPSLVEQRRIVDLIAALDNTIETTESYTVHLKDVLAARRGLAFAGVATVPAPDVFQILQGLQRSPARADGPHQTPYLRSANVLNGSLDLSDVKTMSFDPAQQDKYRLVPGDVLVSEGSASAAAVGAPSEWQGEIPGTVCFQNTLLRYRAIPERTTPGFVSQWCFWAYESGAFREAANGTNIKHIGSGGASRMMVAGIPFEQQDDLVADLEAAQRAVEHASQQADDLRDLRSNLLTALLSGEHVIPASYDDLIEHPAAA